MIASPRGTEFNVADMYRDKIIGVVVPCHNEETQIARTVNTMPDFVDHIVVVDDCSTDTTVKVVGKLATDQTKVHLIQHQNNRGVGGAISTGYVWCRDHDIDVAVVMAGDGQMDPADLPNLLDPVVEDRADYTKGNRLVTGEAWKKIPHARYLGNSALTLLTKIASGYWHVTDSQTGYTALNKKALHLLPLENIFPRYGMPNDFLVTLNIYNMRVMDILVNPVYDIGEKSGIKFRRVIFTLSILLSRLFIKRMVHKYIIRDFHPLVFFYTFGFLLFVPGVLFGLQLILYRLTGTLVSATSALFAAFLFVSGLQSLLFAMLFDMEANRDLKGG
ncbi:MAG: glycosyltransferase family 2 protein [Phycisphaerales bacterium]|nr:glycosyltransferase family 2 protein [Phycisphaerales bacterium]